MQHLFCVSPFVLFMSASFMNHVSALFFLLLFLYGTEKSLESGTAWYGFVAGIAIGVMLNTRPGEAAVVGPSAQHGVSCSKYHA